MKLPRILIVDDDQLILENLQAFFEDEGFQVDSVERGESAIDLLNQHRYQACIIDIRLPGIDGHQVIRHLAECQPDLKCLIHTGSSNYQLPQEIERLGYDQQHVFRKPVEDMGLLLRAVHRSLPK